MDEPKLKKVKLKLAGLDGNAFSILGAFSGAARKQKWPQEEIDRVCKEAMSGDYQHLLRVISSHCAGNGLAKD